MKVRESRDSLLNQLAALVIKYCPDLKIGEKNAHRQNRGNFLGFYKNKFSGRETKVDIYPMNTGHLLFTKDAWEDIDIEIFAEKYFNSIKKVAEEYEKISGKTATITKIF